MISNNLGNNPTFITHSGDPPCDAEGPAGTGEAGELGQLQDRRDLRARRPGRRFNRKQILLEFLCGKRIEIPFRF